MKKGTYTVSLIKEYERYGRGIYPREVTYLEIGADEEESLARYLAGQEQFEPTGKKCARCGREIKQQYTHCYRCKIYLEKTARLQEEVQKRWGLYHLPSLTDGVSEPHGS